MDKQTISPLQLGMLMFPTIMITAVLLGPAITSEIAGRDMWISPIWASLMGVLAAFLAWKLHDLFKQKTIIQYSVDLLGLIPGKIIGLLYLFFYLHINSLVLTQYSHFIVGYFLNHTPTLVTIIGLVLVCAISVRSGLEVMARSSLIVTPLIIIFILAIFLLLIPDLNAKFLLPVMGDGIMPSIRGAMVPQGWFTHFFIISFFLPHVANYSHVLRSNMVTIVIITSAIVATSLFALMLFDNSNTFYSYPIWNATRYISIADFIEHVEAIVLFIWLGGIFVKVSVFYYVLASGTAQWFQFKNYQSLVFPLGIIIISLSMWNYPTLEEADTFLTSISPYYLSIVQVGVPAILLAIALIKRKWKRKGA